MNTKNTLLVILLVVLPFLSMAQDSPAQKFIKGYDGKEGFTTVSISKAMFRMLSKVKSDDPDYQVIARIASKLEDFKILIYEAKDVKIAAGFTQLVKTLKNNNYEDLMSVNEGENHIAFSVVERNNRIRELVMTITGEENLVMLIKGDFLLDELVAIANDMNIAGMNKIQQIKKR